MEKAYTTIEVCYLGHSPSRQAIFITLDDEEPEDSKTIPVAVIHEDSVTELESASYMDVLDIEVFEDFANAHDLI